MAYKIERRDIVQLMNKIINADYLNNDIKNQDKIVKDELNKLIVDSTYIEGKDEIPYYDKEGIEINYHDSKRLAIHGINTPFVQQHYQLTHFDSQTGWKNVLIRLDEYQSP